MAGNSVKKYAVDLHIHTALSPCASDDMTPINILNMAKLCGIDIIAITDHNSCKNVGASIEASKHLDILVIPGMEVTTKEEAHMICLFPDLERALEFQDMVYARLTPVKNRKEYFGNQLILDPMGNVLGEEEQLLLTSTSLSIDDVVNQVTKNEGICIPSHIDRQHYSVLSNLGFIPKNLGIKAVEISKNVSVNDFAKRFPDIKNYLAIKSSDAHSLEDIPMPTTFMQLNGKTFYDVASVIEGQERGKVILE
ncbi:MAG: 3,5-nucleoside bisphosphate phosphatase [Thermosediminibacterales bacterium]|nr:3,5-nucleoside bisphosphate phosphatase [Thermosediminibacterales bacterium]MDK2835748.1 3,5-nucleoside bisphosphate phosphatase [Thermosediminibacterales bacterium]